MIDKQKWLAALTLVLVVVVWAAYARGGAAAQQQQQRQPPSAPREVRYDYLQINNWGEVLARGGEGWELVAVTEIGGQYTYFLKRAR